MRVGGTHLARLRSFDIEERDGDGLKIPGPDADVATTIIIPHFNDLDRLSRTLNALDADLSARRDVEIIVADNGSKGIHDQLVQLTQSRAKLVVEKQPGAGPARNAGVTHARGRVLAFVDSDCLPKPGWLAAGEAALQRCDVVGGRVDTHLEHDALPTGPDLFETVFAFNNRAYVERKGFTGSGNLFCRREVFDAVGGFRSVVSEDVDWSHRATAAGYTLCYCDAAAVSHPTRSDWSALLTKWRRIQREGYALHRSSGGTAWGWLARAAALPLSIAAHAPRALRDPRVTDWRSRALILGALTRLRLWRFMDTVRAVAEGQTEG